MIDALRNFLRMNTPQDSEMPPFEIKKPEDIDINSIHEISIKDIPKEARSKLDLESDKGYLVSSVHSLSLGEDRTAFIVSSEDKTNPKTNRHIEVTDYSPRVGFLGRIKLLMPSNNQNHPLYSENGSILFTETPTNLRKKGLSTQRLILANAVSQKFWNVPLASSKILLGEAPEKAWKRLFDEGIVDALPKPYEAYRQRYTFRKRDQNQA